jgi:hypothetical protein
VDQVNTTGFEIQDASGNQRGIDLQIPSGSFAIASWTSGFLNNSGDKVKLVSPSGEVICEMTFPACHENLSWAFYQGQYVETTTITPGNPNQITMSATATPHPSNSPTAIHPTAATTATSPTDTPKITDYLSHSLQLSITPDRPILGSVAGILNYSRKATMSGLINNVIASGSAKTPSAIVARLTSYAGWWLVLSGLIISLVGGLDLSRKLFFH